jgi:hypothetical protein
MSAESYQVGVVLGRHKGITIFPAGVAAVAGFTAVLSLLWQVAQAAPPVTELKAAPTPAAEAQKNKSDNELNIVLNVARALKSAVKNPASFELVSAGYSAGRAVCIEYRATNSFNAIVPGNYVSLHGAGSAKAKDWNKYCARQHVTDYSNARYFLK